MSSSLSDSDGDQKEGNETLYYKAVKSKEKKLALFPTLSRTVNPPRRALGTSTGGVPAWGRRPGSTPHHVNTTSPINWVNKTVPKKGEAKTTKKVVEESGESWKELFYIFTQESTIHGVRYTTERETPTLRKFLWFCIVATALGVLVYYGSDRLEYYFRYVKNVNVEVNYKSSVEFPAVTLCNQNAFRITSLDKNGWYNKVNNLFSPTTTTTSLMACSDEEFECDNKECVAKSKACDLFPDCSDGSDERNCNPCPLLYVRTTPEIKLLIPEVSGFKFEIQRDIRGGRHATYVREGWNASIYLYYESGKWRIGEIYGIQKKLYAVVDSFIQSPQFLVANWKIVMDDGSLFETMDMVVACSHKITEIAIEETHVDGSGDNLNLQTLYDGAGHEQADFIKGCVWKGSQCRPSAIQPKLTDMGKCFTFYNREDMNIEQSGPGYGLSITVNIENYEYASSSEDGIGIKVLMHHSDDEAMVKERGVAVSPGLYSFLSVEKTQVVNLKPPWGNCGESELSYYPSDTYSLSRCIWQRETEAVYTRCGCRDYHQPSQEGRLPVCDIDAYASCAKPALEYFKKNSSLDCMTPCSDDAYVATTSFAILVGKDSTKARDVHTLQLQQRLFNAREVSHRVMKSKYTATMRTFHVLNQQIDRMVRFARASQENLNQEYRTMHHLMSDMLQDCVTARDYLQTAQQRIDKYIIIPVTSYRDFFKTRIYLPYQELTNKVNATLYQYPSFQFSSDPHSKDNYLAWQNASAWQVFSLMESGIEMINQELYSQIVNKIRGIDVMANLRLHKSRLDTLISQISTNCEECIDIWNTPILELVRDKVIQAIEMVPQRLQLMTKSFKQLYETYIKDMRIMRGSYYETTAFYKDSNSIFSKLTYIMDGLEGATETAYSASYLITNLVDFIWRMNCQTKSDIFIDNYNGDHNQTHDLLQEVMDSLREANQNWTSFRHHYVDRSKTLEDVGNEFSFTTLQNVVFRKETRLETGLNKRLQNLEQIRKHISSVSYLLSSIISDDVLSTSSPIWDKFKISSPRLLYSEPELQLINVELGQTENVYWEIQHQNLRFIKDSLTNQVALLTERISEASSYFKEYTDGNKLTPEFYGKNFLQVELFYKELTERSVSQQKAYDYQNLLSEIGGFMGLLMGGSVISIMELLDLLIYNSWRKIVMATGDNKKSDGEEPEEELEQTKDMPDVEDRYTTQYRY